MLPQHPQSTTGRAEMTAENFFKHAVTQPLASAVVKSLCSLQKNKGFPHLTSRQTHVAQRAISIESIHIQNEILTPTMRHKGKQTAERTQEEEENEIGQFNPETESPAAASFPLMRKNYKQAQSNLQSRVAITTTNAVISPQSIYFCRNCFGSNRQYVQLQAGNIVV